MTIEAAAFWISVLSLVVAVSAFSLSVRRYRLQIQGLELQKKEANEKYKPRLQIADEQFLTSHTLGPKEPAYYEAHPEEIDFEYRARYENKGVNLIEIKSLMIAVRAVELSNFFDCGEIIVTNRCFSPGEGMDIRHRLAKSNLAGFKAAIEHEAGRRGVLQFEIRCDFVGLDQVIRSHRRILYRLTDGGGDISCQGYDPGHGKDKHHFVY